VKYLLGPNSEPLALAGSGSIIIFPNPRTEFALFDIMCTYSQWRT
jgi:hypothetical protein